MKKAMHITGKVATGLLVLLLLSNLYFVISSKINGGEPKVFGHQLMVVLSGSMSPAFETGALIAVKPGNLNTEYQTGDVITFRSRDDHNTIITHRVIEVTEQNGQRLYLTQGDANDAPDASPVEPMQIIGQYSGFQMPWMGYFMNFVKSKAGMAIFLIVPGVLLIFGPIISLFRTLLKREGEKAAEETAAAEEETNR